MIEFGFLLNQIFILAFFIIAPRIKEWNRARWEREQFKLKLRTIIEKGFEKIDLSNIEWKESDPDTLLDWYINQDKIQKVRKSKVEVE